ncbi:MAG TPA: hypothetical protein PL124_09045 [Candidatus Cloacimonadota bacterium]|nr:hypothetical protein [Candidatus Cloacimonadota bacterium]HPS39543.1 hypothetical protein [Candidatus Cloacimonadota bacterium]
MLAEVVAALIKKLASTATTIEIYEGQFEQFDEIALTPPGIYIKFMDANTTDYGTLYGTLSLTLFLITSSVGGGKDTGMLDLVESVYGAIDSKPLVSDTLGHLGHITVKSFKDQATYPGLIVWEMPIEIDK